VKAERAEEKKAAKERNKNYKTKQANKDKTGGESEKRKEYGSDSGRGVAAGRGTSHSNA
jgi:hypothetical protein